MRGIKPRLQNSVRHPISLSLPRTRFSVAPRLIFVTSIQDKKTGINKMKTVLLTAVISLAVLSGCKSTHRYDVLAPNDPIPLTINSTDIYQWDNDDSVPFNLAKLGYNSGVGRGVNDSANPQANVVGKSSVGLSAVSGFLYGGVLNAMNNSH